MKLSRRLIPAFAMLLVSAVLMSTASFAWFSINDVVIADGMAITATADSSLVIKGAISDKTSDTVYTSHGQNTYSGVSLKPVTSFDGKNFGALSTGMRVESEVSANASWTGTDGAFASDNLTKVDASSNATAGTNTYVLESVYNIKNIGANSKVYVEKITVKARNQDNTADAATTAGKLLPAIRVAVEIVGTGSGETAVPAPADATRLVYNAGNGNLIQNQGVGKYTAPAQGAPETDKGTWELVPITYTAQGSTGETAVSLGTLTADKDYEVHVYIWIEGQDQACTSQNVDLSQYAIEIQFKGAKQ